MQIDGEGHGQDEEFTAAFNEKHGAPADPAGDDADRDGGQGADADASADKDGADPAPSDKTATDPWAGASAEALAERDRLIAERDKFRHSDASQRGRISALTRQLQSRQTPDPQPQPDKGEPQGDDDKGDDDAKTPEQKRAERNATLREEYPDVAGPLLDMLEDAFSEIDRLKASTKPVIEATNSAEIDRQEKLLAAQHPDFATVATSKEFIDWANAQPEEIRALARDSFDAEDVSAVLTLFKTERAAKAAADDPDKGDTKPQDKQRDDRRERQLHGGRERPSRAAPAATGAPDDFGEAFEFFAKKRERQAAGR